MVSCTLTFLLAGTCDVYAGVSGRAVPTSSWVAIFARFPIQNWIQRKRALSIAWLGLILAKLLSLTPSLLPLAFGADHVSRYFIYITFGADFPVFAEYGRCAKALILAGLRFSYAVFPRGSPLLAKSKVFPKPI